MTPYVDITPTIRKFSEDVSESELQWHRDEEDREIVSIDPTNWKIQIEDQLPMGLNFPVNIEAGTWHRVIKGKGDLTVKIIRTNVSK